MGKLQGVQTNFTGSAIFLGGTEKTGDQTNVGVMEKLKVAQEENNQIETAAQTRIVIVNIKDEICFFFQHCLYQN